MFSFFIFLGKDQIIFVTKEDHDTPSKALISLSPDEDEEPGKSVVCNMSSSILPHSKVNSFLSLMKIYFLGFRVTNVS